MGLHNRLHIGRLLPCYQISEYTKMSVIDKHSSLLWKNNIRTTPFFLCSFFPLCGATTLRLTTRGLTTFYKIGLIATIFISGAQQKHKMMLCWLLLFWGSHFYWYSKCHYAECRGAHYACNVLMRSKGATTFSTTTFIIMTLSKNPILWYIA